MPSTNVDATVTVIPTSSNLLRDTRKIGILTDIGQVRTVDEDSIMATEISFAVNSQDHKFRLLVVADGMGGPGHGDEASKIALNTVSKTVMSGLFEEVSLTRLLERGIQNANQDILEYVNKHPKFNGMGTTMVCALIKDDSVYLANIGDSRAYVISSDEIRRITKDHSYVQELIDRGEITEKESRTHPKNNIITKAIGANLIAKPDTMRLTLNWDESLLLCCDGVIAHLTDEDIHDIIINSNDPQNACQKITDMTNEQGGSDNISLVILSTKIKDDILEHNCATTVICK